jgi:hypothetical protein
MHAVTKPPIRVEKRRQPFIRTHNEPLSVIAMRVSNKNCFVVAFGSQLKRPCNYQCDWKSDCYSVTVELRAASALLVEIATLCRN